MCPQKGQPLRIKWRISDQVIWLGHDENERGNGVNDISVVLTCLLAYALAYAGMASLSLGMEKHYVQARGSDLTASRKKLFKATGWSLLILAVLPAIYGWGLTIGIVVWTGFVSLAAISVVLVLSYFPRQLIWLGAGMAGIVFSGLLLAMV